MTRFASVVGATAAALCFSGSALASTFSFTGGEQSWSVPAGVTEVHVVAIGAPGGGAAGGEGAVVSANVPIPVGQRTLYVEVGGPGSGLVGGFNGGGDGASADGYLSHPSVGGGGASDIRACSRLTACSTSGGSLASRLVVAGAGGGGQSPDGSAGGNAGAPGSPLPDPSLPPGIPQPAGGLPGTQSHGGRGGGIGCAEADSGTLGQGGTGGAGARGNPNWANYSGSGGGGGLYGGGGGEGYDELCNIADIGGGGGGSSYVVGDPVAPPFTLDASRTPAVVITPVTEPPGGPSLLCTFTVKGRYRAHLSINVAYLEGLGVPPGEATGMLDNLAARAYLLPANSNVHCSLLGAFGPPPGASTSGHPSPSAPYVSCQLNNVTPANNTIFSFDEAFLQSVGVDPGAWPAVIEHLSALAARLPGSFGVTCTTLNAGHGY